MVWQRRPNSGVKSAKPVFLVCSCQQTLEGAAHHRDAAVLGASWNPLLAAAAQLWMRWVIYKRPAKTWRRSTSSCLYTCREGPGRPLQVSVPVERRSRTPEGASQVRAGPDVQFLHQLFFFRMNWPNWLIFKVIIDYGPLNLTWI